MKKLIIIFLMLLSVQGWGNTKNDSILYVPIVFHNLFSKSSEQVATPQVMDILKQLNQEFSPSTQEIFIGVRSIFQSVTGSPKIQFVLAQRDSLGVTQLGMEQKKIHRPYFLKSNIEDVKQGTPNGFQAWDCTKYINIWICHISSFNPKYKRYSGLTKKVNTTDATIPGIVIDYRDFNDSRVIIHEMGHFLGLIHTWGNYKYTCNYDDGMKDTPKCQEPAFGCINPKNTCESIQQWENWMDYSACSAMFTKEQCLRMRTVLTSNLTYYRNSPYRLQPVDKWPLFNLNIQTQAPLLIKLNNKKVIPIWPDGAVSISTQKAKKTTLFGFYPSSTSINGYYSILRISKKEKIWITQNTPIHHKEPTILTKGRYRIYITLKKWLPQQTIGAGKVMMLHLK